MQWLPNTIVKFCGIRKKLLKHSVVKNVSAPVIFLCHLYSAFTSAMLINSFYNVLAFVQLYIV